MKPHYPVPYRKEDKMFNNVVKIYTEMFEDAVGNIAEVTYVDYTDKNGQLNERYPLRYKWLS